MVPGGRPAKAGLRQGLKQRGSSWVGKRVLAGGEKWHSRDRTRGERSRAGLQGSERWRPSEAAEPRTPGLAAVPLRPRRIPLAVAGEQVKGTQEDIMNLGPIL